MTFISEVLRYPHYLASSSYPPYNCIESIRGACFRASPASGMHEDAFQPKSWPHGVGDDVAISVAAT